MEIQEYATKKKAIYTSFLEFIDCLPDEREENLQKLLDILSEEKILDNFDDMHEILVLIHKVTKNHHRSPDFFDKIENIFNFLEDKIKQTFTNSQILKIFKNNKRILLLLFNHEIITADEAVIDFIVNSDDMKYKSYKFYFFNVIKEKIQPSTRKSIEKEILDMDSSIFEIFDENCLKGENDSLLCSLIRNDSIEEFVTFINWSNTPLISRINYSIFETNPLIFKKYYPPTLLEYSAFCGSFQICQFLLLNHVNFDQSLYSYAIHGRNPEVIHLLESNLSKSHNVIYEDLIDESIKCHHNELVSYFRDNFINNAYIMERYQTDNVRASEELPKKEESIFSKIFNFFKPKAPPENANTNADADDDINTAIDNSEKKFNEVIIYYYCLRYYDYEYIPTDLYNNNKAIISHLLKYNHNKMVKLLITDQVIGINDKIVYIIIGCFNDVICTFFYFLNGVF